MVWPKTCNIGRVFSERHHERLREARRKQVPPMLGRKQSEETKMKCRKSNKKTCSNILIRERRSVSATNQWKNIGENDRYSINLKIIEANIGGFWYGNIRYYGVRYCSRFSGTFRERVRAFQGFRCALCGHIWSEEERRLAVHHVHARKDSCCNENAPRQFVCLCPSTCHGKTIRKEQLYARRFTNYLKKNFDGKCFFTKDGMVDFLNLQSPCLI